MKKLVLVMVLLVVLSITIAIANASSDKKDVKKTFLSGKSKIEIADTISKLSTVPMLVFAKEYGITNIQGKEIDPNTILNPPEGIGGLISLFADRPMGTDPMFFENEPSIAAKPSSTSVVVAASHKYPYTTAPTIRCVAYTSTDGGETWSAPVQLPILSTNTLCSDPVVRWAPDSSRVYAAYMSYGGTGVSSIVVSNSIDNGVTWSAPAIALSAAPGDLVDKPWMDVHTFWNNANTSKRVYVTATYFGSTTMRIVFTRSANYAAPGSFEANQTLASTPYAPVIQGSRPIGGKRFSSTNADVLACWYNSESDGFLTGVFDIRCKSNSRYGASGFWSGEITAVNNKQYELEYYLNATTPSGPRFFQRWWGGMFPSMIIANDGTAHIVFTADPSRAAPDVSGEAGNIYYARSPRPYTSTWSVPRNTVNDVTSQAQGYPTITAKKVSGGTILVAAWEDHRNSPYTTPAGENCGYGTGVGSGLDCYYDIYMASTSPGGTDWRANQNKRVTDVSSMSDGLSGFIGDYIDSSTNRVTSDMTAQIVWTDRSDISSIFLADDDVWSDRVDTKNS